MKKKLLVAAVILTLGLGSLAVAGWRAGLFDFGPVVPRGAAVAIAPPFEYVGVVHCHSDLSDGGASVPEILAVAERLGMDFLILTDHNTMEGVKYLGDEGRCLLVVGEETSTNNGHLVSVGIPDLPYRLKGEGDEAVDEIHALGGISILPHPINDRFAWKGRPPARIGAIEIFNGDTAWRNASLWKLVPGFLAYWVNPGKTLVMFMDPPNREMSLWDDCLTRGPVAAIAGSDAHGKMAVGPLSLPFPRYRDALAIFPVHILTDESLGATPERDRAVIVEAIRSGSMFVSVGPLGDARGFRFTAEEARAPAREPGDAVTSDPSAPGRGTARMGGSIETSGPVTLRAVVPAARPVRLVLKRDGSPVGEVLGSSLERSVSDAGVYRVEVYAAPAGQRYGRIPWIVSNAIRVNAKAPSEPVPAGDLCGSGEALVRFDADREPFALEGEPGTLSTTGRPEVIAAGEGCPEACVRLGFEFPKGALDRLHPPFWALADRSSRDLSEFGGISFQARSDRRLRFKIQIRDEDPSGEEGTGWFQTTFVTTPEWRCVTLPFSKFRAANKNGDGRLDLARVRGLFILADHFVLKPGVAGTLWLADMRALPAAAVEKKD